MKTEEYVIASRAIHIELERLAGRLLELAKYRCAETSNQAFLNIMSRQSELLESLAKLDDQASAEFKISARASLS